MKTRFKPCERKQMLLLPPSIMDWLPEGHFVHFIIDVVEQLDLCNIYLSYDSRSGQQPYDPTMMTALLLYAYCVGVPSSRQIEKRSYEDVAFRMLTANRHPDHDSICAFIGNDIEKCMSFLRKQESRWQIAWMPPFAGMTTHLRR
jgi:transposase